MLARDPQVPVRACKGPSSQAWLLVAASETAGGGDRGVRHLTRAGRGQG